MRRSIILLGIMLIAGIGSAVPAAASTHGIQSAVNQSLCLDIQGNSTASGAKVIIGTCSGTPTQTWHVRATTTVGRYSYFAWQLQNGAGMCLAVPDSTGQAVQASCNPTSDYSQIWIPQGEWGPFDSDPGDGWYWFWNASSHKCLSIYGTSYASGAPVLQDQCTTAFNPSYEVWYSVSTR